MKCLLLAPVVLSLLLTPSTALAGGKGGIGSTLKPKPPRPPRPPRPPKDC